MGWPFSDKLQGALWDRCLGELFLKIVKILGPSLWAVEGILEAGTSVVILLQNSYSTTIVLL